MSLVSRAIIAFEAAPLPDSVRKGRGIDAGRYNRAAPAAIDAAARRLRALC